MNIQIEKLRSFVLIAEEKNLTRAAERRFSTPAAVSAQLKQLEDTLSLQLFERTSKGMLLTDAGCKLLPMAYRVLGNLAELETTARAIAGQAKTRLLLGLNALPELLRIESVLEASGEELPDVSLVVKSSNSADNQIDVLAGQLDAGFVYGGRDHEDLVRTELGYINVVTIAPARMSLPTLPEAPRELAHLPWITPSPECPYIELMRKTMGVHYGAMNSVASSDEEYSTIAMVKAGLGLGLVEEHLAEMAAARGDVTVFPESGARVPLFLVMRKDRRKALAELEVFAQLVEEQWACGNQRRDVAGDVAPATATDAMSVIRSF